MRSQWLFVLAGFAVAMSSFNAQFTQEAIFRADPNQAGRYTASTAFGAPVREAISDAVLFAAPIGGVSRRVT